MSTDQVTRYRVATYSYACTAYVRTTLRRALELQNRDNVWSGTESVNAARGMVAGSGVLPDTQVWRLTETELMTIHLAIQWRKGMRRSLRADTRVRGSVIEEWSRIEDEILRVLREVWHSQGKYWM